MELKEETYRKFGYYPSDLAPQSHKYVIVECDGCGEIRDTQKRHSHNLCRKCSQPTQKPSKKTVLFIGDVHIGAESVDVDKIKRLAKKYWRNTPIILMGDLADFGIKKPMLYQNTLKPQEQVTLVSEIFKPLDIRAFCIGNHDNRLFKEVGLNIWITIFEMQPSNSIEINGRSIFFNHGSSSASSAFLEYNKYIYSVKGSVIALGHSHLLAKKTILRQGEMTHLVRTGGFLGQDFYVRMAGYAEQLKGWAEFDTVNNIVHLRAWDSETEETFEI